MKRVETTFLRQTLLFVFMRRDHQLTEVDVSFCDTITMATKTYEFWTILVYLSV
jgi:hypothetical protein